MKRMALFLSLSLAAGCGGDTTATSSPDPIDANDVDIPADSAEANGLLEFLNDEGTTFEVLDPIVDSRAAENLVTHRPYASIDAVDAVPYVGPVAIEKLTQHVEGNGWLAYQGGAWEGVPFTGTQLALALDLAGSATFDQLDLDAGLDARAAENIIDTRPITSMNELAAIAYVGPSTLKKIRTYLPKWQENGTSVEVYDGVVFTHLEATRALAAANDANLDALSSVDIYGSPANIIIGGRPWASLQQLSSKAGIGSLTLSRLKVLGQAYDGAPPYVVTAADAAYFESSTKSHLAADSQWHAAMSALLQSGDLSDSPAWVGGTVEKIRTAIESRLAAFADGEVGRSYSSRDAAFQATISYVENLKLAAKTEYPSGVLSLVAPLTQAERLARGKTGMLAWWQSSFVGTPEWNATFDNRTWDDVKGEVGADIASFENSDAYEVYQVAGETIFVGRVYGLYTEVNVDPVGKVTRVYAEID